MKKIIIFILITSIAVIAGNLFHSPSDRENAPLFFSQDLRVTDNPADLYLQHNFAFIFKAQSWIQSNQFSYAPLYASIQFPLHPFNFSLNYQNFQWYDAGNYDIHKLSFYAQKQLMSDDEELFISVGMGVMSAVATFVSDQYKDNTFSQPGISGSMGILTKYHKTRMSFFYSGSCGLYWSNPWVVKSGNSGSKFQLDYTFYLSGESVFSISAMMRMPLIYPNPAKISSVTILKKEEVRGKLDYEKRNIFINNLTALFSIYTVRDENLNLMVFNEWTYNIKKIGISIGYYSFFPINKIKLNVSVQGGVSFAL